MSRGNYGSGIGRSAPGPHPPAISLVGSYVYSYDVAAAHRQPTTSRSIPGMRPSYDAEHPYSATPIYDSLYSEYRRLFRALPGDRTGEEDLRFTGFAVRDTYATRESLTARDTFTTGATSGSATRDGYQARAVESAGYPQQQAFHTYPGHAQGTPQFMPAQQQFQNGQAQSGHSTATGHLTGQISSSQFSGGQGWVATGYLAPSSQPAPAATPAATPGTTTSAGRHRSMLSLPPGRVPVQG